MPIPLPVTTQKSKLCSRCAEALSGPPQDWDRNNLLQRIPYSWKSRYLVTSAREGCRICRLFLETVPVQELENLFKDGFAMMHLVWNPEGAVFEEIVIGTTSFILAPVTAEESAKLNNLLPNQTSSEACWTLIYQWFTDCLLTHHKCHTESEDSFMIPSRLIDVGHVDGQEVRLVVAQELGPEANQIQYVALSHSWRSGPVTKLLKGNLAQFQEVIPLQDLSQTFQDAISVTRRINVRYLWIDSLCILQDCADDWRRESSAMRDIYKGCVCNIAATAASRGSDGLFVERDPLPISPFMINIDWIGHKQEYLCYSGTVRYSGFVRAPLNRRGWVMQERLLSTRTIHFGSQIFWECKEHEACETYPKGLGNIDGNVIDDGEEVRVHSSLLQGKSWLNKIMVDPACKYSVWVQIVESFMCCGLTYEEDKLIALSGLVKEMQPFMDDEYLAGLWKNDLVDELAWAVSAGSQVDGTQAVRPSVYRAPSWSWASVEGRVVYPELHKPVMPLVTILEASTTPRTADRTGQIVGGWIKVYGRPKPLPAQLPDIFGFFGMQQSSILIDDWRPVTNLTDLEEIGDDFRLLRYQRDLEGFVILPLLSDAWDRNEQLLLGLLLQPLGTAADTFRRVGLLSQMSSTTDGTMDERIPGLEWDFQKNDWKTESDEASIMEKTLTIF